MNLMLHGIDSPNVRYADTLSKGFDEERLYDVVLANLPFKGAIDAADVNPSLPATCKKTEILFLHLFVRLLENGGRAAVIVPGFPRASKSRTFSAKIAQHSWFNGWHVYVGRTVLQTRSCITS